MMERKNCCHKEHENGHSHGKHGSMMWICLIMMALGMLILPRFGGPFAIAAALICPLMHLVLMGSLFKKGRSD